MEVNIENMKKLFSEKKITKKSFIEFFDKKGFYIVLVMCIVIVGATAVFVTMNNPASSNEDLNNDKLISDESLGDYIPDIADGFDENAPIDTSAVSSLDTTTEEKTGDTESSTVTAVTEEKAEAEKEVEDKATNKVAAAETNTPAKAKTTSKSTKKEDETKVNNQKFIMPVTGQITFDYARDKLVYSKTLEDWRTHDGIDIAAERGTPIKAVSDGVVTDIKKDPRYGITVIIDHQNGLKTVYANLASDEMVNPNQIVKQDEIIGSVGNTAIFESAEQSHLHFEVLKDDKLVDPKSYLPE